jgi:hypothetical protein
LNFIYVVDTKRMSLVGKGMMLSLPPNAIGPCLPASPICSDGRSRFH